ncbi:hypothetical protein GGR56DRAFT_674573 [Xylariaceae sp. FL0804]|nr:hypothetical protein GGR56DRAFT_674573 [Xylariaceae sp. FL0804]
MAAAAAAALKLGLVALTRPAVAASRGPVVARVPTTMTMKRSCISRCNFSTTPPRRVANQIYSSVRRPEDLHTYQMLSSSARTPLSEAEGGVAYCAVEYDAPDVMSAAAGGGLGLTFMITSIPTLLSFDAGEAQAETRVADARRLADRAFLEDWVRAEARRHGGRGGGGPGILGGLFGSLKK